MCSHYMLLRSSQSVHVTTAGPSQLVMPGLDQTSIRQETSLSRNQQKHHESLNFGNLVAVDLLIGEVNFSLLPAFI